MEKRAGKTGMKSRDTETRAADSQRSGVRGRLPVTDSGMQAKTRVASSPRRVPRVKEGVPGGEVLSLSWSIREGRGTRAEGVLARGGWIVALHVMQRETGG